MTNINTHRGIVIQILREVFSKKELSSLLGFKGGTALYLFYDLPRFSADLDFDLLDDKQEETVMKQMRTILENFGTIKEARIKRQTIFFLLSYGDSDWNIKIEISKRNFGSRYEIKDYLGMAMRVMVKEDIFAHKLVALSERKKIAHRDLFDIWFMLKNGWPINQAIIEQRTGLKLNIYLKKVAKIVTETDNRHILSGIGELLDEKRKLWVKTRLLDDLLFLLKLKQKNFIGE